MRLRLLQELKVPDLKHVRICPAAWPRRGAREVGVFHEEILSEHCIEHGGIELRRDVSRGAVDVRGTIPQEIGSRHGRLEALFPVPLVEAIFDEYWTACAH